MTDSEKVEIDAMSHEEMARKFRFSSSSDVMMQGKIGAYFMARFKELGGMTLEMSKRIGW